MLEEGSDGGYWMASEASCDNRDFNDFLGNGRMRRSGKMVDAVSGDER